MALNYPDILQHNNPSYSLVDITSVRGTAYQLANLSATGSIPADKRKVGIIVFVTGESQFYAFYGTNVNQWDDNTKWKALTNVESANRAEYITTGSLGVTQTILGTLTVNGGITGSLFGTATSTITAATASFTPNALVTASVNLNTITFTRGNGTTFNLQINTGSAILLPGGTSGQIQFNNNNTFGGVSRLTFDGTTLRATGSFTGSFVGNLTGTSSWATNASSSNYIDSSNVYGPVGYNSILTSSYALTASYIEALNLPDIFPILVTGSTMYSFNSFTEDDGAGGQTVYNISPDNNFIIGNLAGAGGSITDSIIIGENAAYAAGQSEHIVALGSAAAMNIGKSRNSVYIGPEAGRSTTSTGSIYIGQLSGRGVRTNYTINIGIEAGRQAWSGSYSTLIGYRAGYNTSFSSVSGIGPNNIIIGTNISLPNGRRDSINIGGILFGTGSYSDITTNPLTDIAGNGRIGINVLNPLYTLDVSGSVNFRNGLFVTGSNRFIGNQTISGSIFGSGSNTFIGNTTISGSLNTSGSNLFVGITTATGSLNMTGSTNLVGTTGITGSINITGSSTIIGITTMTGSLNITGSTTQIGNNTLLGNTQLSGSIGISGSSTIVGTTTMSGSLSITGSTTQIGNNTLLGNTALSGSITISGSLGNTTPTIEIWGDVKQRGYIQFEPVTTGIDQSVTASYIYVSGSTNDLYFTQNGQGYNNTTRLRWLESNMYTGILKGGVLSSTPGSTEFMVTGGDGIIVSMNAATGSDPYPTIKQITWPTQTLPIIYSGSAAITYVGISNTGQIVQQTNAWGSTDTRQWHDQIALGVVLHLTGSVSTGVFNSQQTSYGTAQKQDDFFRAFGPLKISGHTLQASGSTLGLVKTAGVSYKDGANYVIDPNHPSTVVEDAITTSKIYRYHISGSTPIIDSGVNGAGYEFIDNFNYYNLTTNQLTSLTGGGNNQFTIQRVFWIPNSPTRAFIVYYGNAVYGSAAEAAAGLQTEPFSEAPNTAQNAIYLGAVIVEGNATSLTSAVFVPGGIFRSVGGVGASGGSSVATALDNLSDVALTTEEIGDLLMYGVGGAAQWGNTKTLTGNYTISGSLSLTGNVNATASSATNALTSSKILGGSDGYLPLWSGTQTLTSSIAQQSGSVLIVSGNLILSESVFVKGLETASLTQLNVVLFDTGSGKLYYTSSISLGSSGTGAGFPFSGSAVVTGSLLVSGSGITGSLLGTASNALTSSNVLGGQNNYIAVWTGSTSLTHSIIYQTGSSIGINTITPTGSLYVSGAIYFPSLTQSISESFVLMYNTASGQLFYTASSAIGGRGSGFPFTGTAVITGSLNVSGSGITGSLLGTASNVAGGTTNYIPVWISGSRLTGSIMQQSGSSIQLTGSLYVSNSVFIPNIQSGSSLNVVMLGENGQLIYTSSAAVVTTLNTKEIESNRYDFFTYYFSGSFAAFAQNAVSTLHNYQPNIQNITAGSSPATFIQQYLSYMYVDIIEISTGRLWQKMNFADVSALNTFLTNQSVSKGRITVYSYKNNVSNLKIYGSNQLATLLTPKTSAASSFQIPSPTRVNDGRVSNNYPLAIPTIYSGEGEGNNITADKLKSYFVSNQFYDDIKTKLSNIDEIILDWQIIDLVDSGAVFYLPMKKYDARRLTNFYIPGGGKNFILSNGSIVSGNNKTKILSTTLAKFTLADPSVYVNAHRELLTNSTITYVTTTSIHSISNIQSGILNIQPGEREIYFNIYILQDLATNGRGIGIEFLTIDAINIPFNNKFDIDNTTLNFAYLAKKGNRFCELTPSDLWWQDTLKNSIDKPMNNQHTMINTAEFWENISIRNKSQNKNIDIIRIYDNKTCDIFEKCLQVVDSTYSANLSNAKLKLHYCKMNKK